MLEFTSYKNGYSRTCQSNHISYQAYKVSQWFRSVFHHSRIVVKPCHMATLKVKFSYMATLSFVEMCVAKWLTPRSLDLDVRGSSLALRLDKELYSTLSLYTRVYKWIPVTYCWGLTLRWTSIPSWGK